ncbi:hypothetical protein B2J93_4502 [Marssonina coronariae]|uniref:Uncharacterized protein n=1 Tax=Diplocarpon coronariae TaxID=2795749 RepID=A0A218Z7G8_9HELO|nr:hypothetical protein B2J93_4502 [Marssonina coronariae]
MTSGATAYTSQEEKGVSVASALFDTVQREGNEWPWDPLESPAREVPDSTAARPPRATAAATSGSSELRQTLHAQSHRRLATEPGLNSGEKRLDRPLRRKTAGGTRTLRYRQPRGTIRKVSSIKLGSREVQQCVSRVSYTRDKHCQSN